MSVVNFLVKEILYVVVFFSSRWKRETRDDAGDDSYDWRADAKDVVEEWSEDALDWWETVWGGKCVEGSDVCSAVSYCHVQDEKFGTRRRDGVFWEIVFSE